MPRKKATAVAAPDGAAIRVSIEPGDGTATFYINHAEIGSTLHDFTLLCAKIPAKLPHSEFSAAQATGALTLEAQVQIVFPPSFIVGLIRALTTQKEAFEKQHGVTLVEPLSGAKKVKRYEH
jgi:hypothetical protein